MDRRTIWAILLMMVIAIAPAIFLKRPQPSSDTSADSSRLATPGVSGNAPAPGQDSVAARGHTDSTGRASAGPLPGTPSVQATTTTRSDTIHVTSPLYVYDISTRGGRLIQATLPHYRSMSGDQRGQPAQILPPESRLLGLTVILGRDTIPLQ